MNMFATPYNNTPMVESCEVPTIVLPATHPNTLERRGKLSFFNVAAFTPDGTLRNVIQQVYAPGFRSVLDIPAECIRHLPPGSLNVTRLVLCANYNPFRPDMSCPLGERCKFVHADIDPRSRRQLEQRSIHVNYAWRSLEEVSYDRCAAGGTVRVVVPNSAEAPAELPTEKLLKTQALDKPRTVLSHCAHYYFNRTCNMGPDCQFVHAVFIDPTAKLHQRAPPPFQMQRKLARLANQRGLAQADSCVSFEDAAPWPVEACTDGERTPDHHHHTDAMPLPAFHESGETTPPLPAGPASSSSDDGTPRTWVRHNPYSLTHVLCRCQPSW